MPTKKPIIQVVLEEEYNEKLTQIATKQKRSKSNQAAMIIENFIDNYEKEHGTINVTLEQSNNNNINIGR